MGATGTHRERGITDQAFFEREFPTMLGQHGRILACASKPETGTWNRVFFAAVQNNDSAPYDPGATWCLVVLMHTSRNPNEYYNFTYKEMSDESGPSANNCPDRILDLLSPTDSRYSLEWREQCRDYNRKLAASKLADGQLVRFAKPWKFENDAVVELFRFRKHGRRTLWEALTADGIYRFTCRLGTDWFLRDHALPATTA